MADEGLTPNDFTESLVPDPSQPPPRTIVLEGLVGRSPKEGYWRLYFNEELSNYAEFKEEDLRHQESIPREHYPLPGLEANKVWLDADAQVDFTNTESRRVQAEFLRGDIAEGSLMGAGMAEAVAAGGGGPLPGGGGPLPGPSIAGPCGASIFGPCVPSVAGPCGPRSSADDTGDLSADEPSIRLPATADDPSIRLPADEPSIRLPATADDPSIRLPADGRAAVLPAAADEPSIRLPSLHGAGRGHALQYRRTILWRWEPVAPDMECQPGPDP